MLQTDCFLTRVSKNFAWAGPGKRKSFLVPRPKKWSGLYTAPFARPVEEQPEKSK